jgi:hypothetical protein
MTCPRPATPTKRSGREEIEARRKAFIRKWRLKYRGFIESTVRSTNEASHKIVSDR